MLKAVLMKELVKCARCGERYAADESHECETFQLAPNVEPKSSTKMPLPARNADSDAKPKFDRNAYQKAYMKSYMKDYMRSYRKRQKEKNGGSQSGTST